MGIIWDLKCKKKKGNSNFSVIIKKKECWKIKPVAEQHNFQTFPFLFFLTTDCSSYYYF